MELKAGIKGEAKATVSEDNTAIAFGSGSVRVFATPAMIGLMEKASLSSVDPLLEPGFATVGTKVNIKHLAATPIGMNVVVNSLLIEVDGKRLVFEVEARDDVDLIGTGTHERFIVKLDSFFKRAESKSTKQ
ncbi:MAG: thioesterase family protein [Desulfotomaculaceae bacterium]|nr:thioesterase family protein [Desulfotomaculaceae bacterium]